MSSRQPLMSSLILIFCPSYFVPVILSTGSEVNNSLQSMSGPVFQAVSFHTSVTVKLGQAKEYYYEKL